MTDEERAEYNRLCAEYDRLVAENQRLAVEIDVGVDSCHIVAGNITTVGNQATKDVHYVSDETTVADDVVERLLTSLRDLTRQYFLYKNLSEASKMLTKYNDEYYTKFKFYNELRRITLGYVIGIDAHIVKQESLRKKVEKVYLANTEYWLAYAIMAVMLWASDEKEAADRALKRALTMDCYQSCVFFMLVNIRFGRMDTAKNWFLTLLEKTDVNNMGDEWQHVLRVYLEGGLAGDEAFTAMVSDCFERMVEQTEATSVDFGQEVIARASQYAQTFIHVTERQYLTLKDCCAEYGEIRYLMSCMEKIGVLAKHFNDVYEREADAADNMFERIENVLYDLINAYDTQEYKIIKELRKNEAIVAAQGDREIAQAQYLAMYGEDEKPMRFGDLLLRWAFDDDTRRTDSTVRKFSLAYLKERILKGTVSFFENEHARIRDRYTLTISTTQKIDPLQVVCGEQDYGVAERQITEHYMKNRTKFTLADTFFKVALFLCAGSLLALAIAALTIGSDVAFPLFLVLGIALGVVGGFLVWRRWVDVGKELEEYMRLAHTKLRKAVDEMVAFRKAAEEEYTALADLISAIEQF